MHTVENGSWTRRHFHLGNNKEAFDAETFAIYQVLEICDDDQRSSHRYTISSDSQAAIQRIRSDGPGPGQHWARAVTEVCTRLMARENEVTVLWVPAHSAIEGNEVADVYAKEAAVGHRHAVSDELRWEASLSHPAWVATETRARATAQWISAHVRPEGRYRPLAGSGLRRKALHRVRKSLSSRYYQLLSGHAAVGFFLHERMTGPLRRELGECRWCNCGKRESGHHIFIERRAWAPQIWKLWRGVAKDCGWRHPKAPAVRKLWKEGATEAVLESLGEVRAGCWQSAGVRAPSEVAGDGKDVEGVEGGVAFILQALRAEDGLWTGDLYRLLCCSLFLCNLLCYFFCHFYYFPLSGGAGRG